MHKIINPKWAALIEGQIQNQWQPTESTDPNSLAIKVARLEEKGNRLEFLCEEILATIKVNRERGHIKSSDEAQLSVFMDQFETRLKEIINE